MPLDYLLAEPATSSTFRLSLFFTSTTDSIFPLHWDFFPSWLLDRTYLSRVLHFSALQSHGLNLTMLIWPSGHLLLTLFLYCESSFEAFGRAVENLSVV